MSNMTDNRTNFVKIENLPPEQSGKGLHDYFDPFGDLLEMTAVSPSSVVLTYMRRTAARNCVQCIHNQLYVGVNLVSATYYYPREDLDFRTSSLLQGLGKNIGRDEFVYDYRTFTPWSQPTGNTQGGAFGGARPRSYGAAGGPSRRVVIGGPYAQILTNHTVPWRLPTGGGEVDECPICMDVLGDRRTYNIYSDQERSLVLNGCPHAFHQRCLEALLKASPSPFLQCPNCKKVYGTRTGTRPNTGTIKHRIVAQSLPDHSNSRTIEITFDFRQGVQSPQHPNPGQPFYPVGFPRKAYLPEDEKGIKALHGIYLAWEQKLIFKVGRSLTNSMDNVITWDDIHLKTRPDRGEHGFPDPLFFNNFFKELEGFGLTDASISSHMYKYPGLKDKGSM